MRKGKVDLGGFLKEVRVKEGEGGKGREIRRKEKERREEGQERRK